MDREAGTRIRVSLLAEPEPTHEREEIPRLVRLLALAHRWHRQLDEGVYESQADIAAAVGLTRARITQIMDLYWLPPEILDGLVALRELYRPGCVGLRAASSHSYWPDAFRRLSPGSA